MQFDLADIVGWYPVIEFKVGEQEFDFRNFTVTEIREGATLEVSLLSETHTLLIQFIGAKIIEDNGTTAEAAKGRWLLDISRPDAFDLDSGLDVLTFSLDFAEIEGWVISCKEAIAELRVAERHERVAKEHRREAEARVAELNGELDDAYARRTTGRQARLIFEPITSDAPAGGPVTKPAASAPDDARLTPPKVEEVAWAYNGRTWAIRVKQINPERFLALIPDLATDIEGTGSTAADAIADVQTKASIRLDDVDPGKKPGKKRAKKTGAKKTSSGRGRGRKSVDAVVVEG